MTNKNFKNEIVSIYNMIENNVNFTLSRFGDGEMKILYNENIDIVKKFNGEFKYDVNDTSDSFYRNKLIESFLYKGENYLVGIGCPCCIGDHDYNKIKKLSNKDDDNLTWANIFVNSNYDYYLENILPKFKERKVILVCNDKAQPQNIFPENLVKCFTIGANAWKNDYALVDEIKNYIDDSGIEDHVFLFAAGPFGNILSCELYKHNSNNTYIDIGSTLDIHLGLGKTRDYLSGGADRDKVCIWYEETKMEIIKFDKIRLSDVVEKKYEAWSRIYEYPLVLNSIKEIVSVTNPLIHNTSWGFEGCHVQFKNDLEKLSTNCTHSDLKHSILPNTVVWDITKEPKHEWVEKFDVVINISTVEEVYADHLVIFKNLLQQVKSGGYLMLTFDLPGLQLDKIEQELGCTINTFDDEINGRNSLLPNLNYTNLTCGFLIVRKT